jgi:hypothetical protein
LARDAWVQPGAKDAGDEGHGDQVSSATMSTVTTALDAARGQDSLIGDKAARIARIRT